MNTSEEEIICVAGEKNMVEFNKRGREVFKKLFGDESENIDNMLKEMSPAVRYTNRTSICEPTSRRVIPDQLTGSG